VFKNKSSSLKIQDNIRGILMMFAHAISMSALYVVVKNLTDYMHSDQIGFLYKFTILIIVSISCLDGGFKKHLQTKKIELHALRGVFSILGSLSMFRALNYIGAGDAAALSKLEHSIMVLVGVFVFNEKITMSKIILLAGSVAGAFFIFDFHLVGQNVDIGYFYVLLALFFWLINNVVVKKLGKTERSRAQLFYSSLVASIIAFFFAVPSWQPITIDNMYLIIIAAVASLLHKLTFFKAYKFTDISIASPFDYTRLIITALFAYIFLGEVPDGDKLIGYTLITAVGVYFIFSEAKKQGFKQKG
jgi:S-adenosylmethionine uptake transporter